MCWPIFASRENHQKLTILVFQAILLIGICRADNQNHIITYIKEAKDSPKEFGALWEGDVLGEE